MGLAAPRRQRLGDVAAKTRTCWPGRRQCRNDEGRGPREELAWQELVVGASALMLVALAHQSLRRTRVAEAEAERAASEETA